MAQDLRIAFMYAIKFGTVEQATSIIEQLLDDDYSVSDLFYYDM